MTSSKSSRASIMPSSFSLSSFRSTPTPSTSSSPPSTADSDKGPADDQRIPPRRFSTGAEKTHKHKLQRRDRDPDPRPTTSSSGNNNNDRCQPYQSDGESASPRPLDRKTKTWSSRITSMLPSRMTSSASSSTSTSTRSTAAKKNTVDVPAIMDTAPPPYEPASSPPRRLLSKKPPMMPPPAPTTAPPAPPTHLLPVSASVPLLTTDFGDFNFADHTQQFPQIMDPIPPSPEAKRSAVIDRDHNAVAAPRENSTPPDPYRLPDDFNASPGKLRKEKPESRSRRSSLQLQKEGRESPQLNLPPVSADGAPLEARGRRSISGQQPILFKDAGPGSRVSSLPVPNAAIPIEERTSSPSGHRSSSRRSWMPGMSRSRANSVDVNQSAPKSFAWVMADDTHAEYNPMLLSNGEKVPELWNEGGTILVYLYPRASVSGPSFKIPEFAVNSSYIFNELIQSDRNSVSTGRTRATSFTGRGSLSVEDATRLRSPTNSPPFDESTGELKLYLPTPPPSADYGLLSTPGSSEPADLDRLIAIRNLFAFLTGQPLVATKTSPTIFKAFLQISALLEEFVFTSADGQTFGDAVDLSFGFYVDTMGLADCRQSREKTLEALILGERMRCMSLYNEAFAHAAGKYLAIMDLGLPLWEQIQESTRQKLERAHLDLVGRQHGVNQHLEQFEFPSLFAGIANSTSIAELRQIRFKVWRNAFNKMRSFVLAYYKTTFGNWPPKASSNKNPFAESGLNRLVLKLLYSDMCALYDLLVDRNDLTSRVIDEVPSISSAADKMTSSALRNMMSESDRSRPPVLPPVPFDMPKVPSMKSVMENYFTLSAKEQVKYDKRLKEHELLLILNKAYNWDTNGVKLPFLEHFKDFELREAKGKMAPDLADQRIGYWLFLYVVIQSLPTLVVDAPDLHYTEGVEYFLCQPPMGRPPWVEDQQVRKMWYEVAGGGGIVELSADAVLFSIEATYHRSHCWLAAKAWEGIEGADAPPPEEDALPPLLPPPSVFGDGESMIASSPPLTNTPTPPPGPPVTLRPRNLSPGGNRVSRAYRSSIVMGLEPVPMEPPRSHHRSRSQGPRAMGNMGSRTRSAGNLAAMNGPSNSALPPSALGTGATFDDILAGGDKEKPAPKKKGLFF